MITSFSVYIEQDSDDQSLICINHNNYVHTYFIYLYEKIVEIMYWVVYETIMIILKEFSF